MSERIFIGLGSNLDNPVQQLEKALTTLRLHSLLKVVRCSSFYSSKPVGGPPQPDYINAVAELSTDCPPHDLLLILQSIEEAQGRVRSIKNAPRTLDLDLLFYGDRNLETDTLILPHPRLYERAFVLVPLYEIAPERLPGYQPEEYKDSICLVMDKNHVAI